MMHCSPLSHAAAVLTLAALTLGPATARAQKARILHATRTGESSWVEFVRRLINATGLYPEGVDNADIAYTDPRLADLLGYRLIVVLGSDFGINNGNNLGDALGDYMAMRPDGAVLVFYPYTWQTGMVSAPPIGGRFAANHALTTPAAASTTAATKLGMIVPNDPLTTGLMAFSCGSNCRRLTGLMPRPGATVAALWEDGNLLAIRGRNRVDLNMQPADDTVIAGSYTAAGARLITNAIVYLSSPLSAAPGEAAFPATPLGSTSQPVRLTLRNSSRNQVSVTGLGIEGADASQFGYRSLQTPSFARPLVLSPGATFTVDATYRPQIQGSHTALLVVTTIGFGRTEVPLRGTSKGNLFVSGSPIDFGGIPTGTTRGPVMVTLANAGLTDINLRRPVLSDTMNYALVPFVPFDPVKLAPGATYRFTVEFRPSAAGEFPARVTVESDDPSSPLEIPVRGLAGPPRLQVPYTALLLPDVPFGQKGLPLDILLSNVGNSELTVSDVLSDSTDFEVTMPARPLKIAARETGLVQLVFAPKMAGLRVGRITIKSDEPPPMGMMSSDKIIEVAGTATVPRFRVSSKTIDFGSVDIGTAPGPRTLTLFNDGDGALRVTGLDILAGPGSDSFQVVSAAPVPFVILPFGAVDVSVRIQPRAAGMLSANLRVVTDLMAMGTEQVELKAEVNGAVARVSPMALAFGSQKVRTSAKKSVVVSNIGNRDLTLRGVQLTAGPMAAGVFTTPALANVVIPPGMNRAIEVTFTPTAAAEYTATLDLDTDDPGTMGGTRFQLPLSGSGVIGNVSVMPLSLDFTPAIYVGGRSGMQTIRVRNIGEVAIENLTVRISGPDYTHFQRAGMFKSMLAPGESTDIGFVFEPRVAKAQMSATVLLEADGVAVPMMVQLKGSAISPIVRVQPDTIRFEDTPVESRSMARPVTIVNDGPERLELEVGDVQSEDFEVDLSGTDLGLAPGQSARFQVVFAPRSLGAKSETIEIRLRGSTVVAGTVAVEGVALKKKEMESGGCTASGRGGGPGGLLVAGLLLVLLARRRRSGRAGAV